MWFTQLKAKSYNSPTYLTSPNLKCIRINTILLFFKDDEDDVEDDDEEDEEIFSNVEDSEDDSEIEIENNKPKKSVTFKKSPTQGFYMFRKVK